MTGTVMSTASSTDLPNGDFSAGTWGWTVVELSASGSSWHADPGTHGLVVSSAQSARSAMGSVLLFSPRVRGGPGTWSAGVELVVDRPTTVDLAVVVDAAVPVPGPPPEPPPRASHHVTAGGPVVISARREVVGQPRAVGLRLSLPAGADYRVERAWLDGPSGPPKVVLGLIGPSAKAFEHGALVARDSSLSVRLALLVGGPEHGALSGEVHDVYRGDRRPIEVPGVDLELALPTDRCGVFIAEVSVASPDGVHTSCRYRYAVDVDDAELVVDPAAPWAITAGLVNPRKTGELTRLMGIAHIRLYSGFATFELPVAAHVGDPAVAAAQSAALEFVGAASGCIAGSAAASVAATEDTGRGTEGWPRWSDAAAVATGCEPVLLRPEPLLLEPFRGLSVLAETTSSSDAVTAASVAREVGGALAGRRLIWTVSNEPDLHGRWSPEQCAIRTQEFADAVRGADSGALVVGPTLADGWDSHHQGMHGWEWLERWARAGGLAAVDAVNIHLHMLDEETGTPERERLENLLPRLRALVDRLGGTDLPLWVTEMGWRGSTDDDSGFGPGETGRHVTEADQLDLLVRAGLLAVTSGVSRFYFFHLHGFRWFAEGTRFDWGVVTGLVSAPKPAFLGLRSLVRATAGATGFRLLPTADRVRAVAADLPTGGSAVVWQWSGGAGLFRLDEAPNGVRMQDLLSEPVDGQDLRRPVVLSWQIDDALVHRWLSRVLAERHLL